MWALQGPSRPARGSGHPPHLAQLYWGHCAARSGLCRGEEGGEGLAAGPMRLGKAWERG